MKDLLKEGNVIILGAGTRVYAEIPEMFVYSNTKLSSELTSAEVEIGYIYNNQDTLDDDKKMSTDEIVREIAVAFDRQRVPLTDLTKAYEFVRSQMPVIPSKTFMLPEGEYLVIKTEMTGGGSGHNDTYPDGHNVTCKKLDVDGKYDDNGVEVSFYQSGSFTIMIEPEEIEVVRNVKITRTISYS